MFHAPNEHRLTTGRIATTSDYGNNGMFHIPSHQKGRSLWCQVSDGGGWEHVSIHVAEGKKTRTPTWNEMCFIKDVFWDEEDVVMQLHPAKSEYINNHPHVLHLWRPTEQAIPIPPSIFVGLKGFEWKPT